MVAVCALVAMTTKEPEFMSMFAHLGADNYRVWASRMRGLLVQRRLWDDVHVVTDSMGRQVNADAGYENPYNSETAFHCIPSEVEDIHLATLGSLDSPSGVRHRLKEQYAAASRARIMQLRRNLISCSILKYTSLTEFARELERCRVHLAATGKTIDDDDMLFVLLHGLSPQYSVVGTITEADDSNTFVDAVAKLLAHEGRLSCDAAAEGPVADDHAYAAKAQRPRIRLHHVCYHYGEIGHIQRDCQKFFAEQVEEASVLTTYSGLGVHTPLDWLIVSGASHHVCTYRNTISACAEVFGRTVSCANGQTVPMLGMGSVHLVTDVDGRQTSVWLHDVLSAPGIVSCIISVSKLVETGGTLSFGRKNCTLSLE
jgi:hypothetical protein